MNRKMVGLVALAALLIATPLMAQERQGRRGFGGRGGFGGVSKMALLQDENVQKELEIVDDQKEQLAKIAEEGRGGRGGLGGLADLTPEERATRMREFQARLLETEKKVEAVLLAPQKTRLNEIYVQAAGTAALNDEAIAKELGIGPDLQEKIQETRMEAFAAARGQGGGGRGQFAQMREEVDKKVLALLSAEQQAKFEKMKGKKVDFELNVFGRGGRGGRRGGGDN